MPGRRRGLETRVVCGVLSATALVKSFRSLIVEATK